MHVLIGFVYFCFCLLLHVVYGSTPSSTYNNAFLHENSSAFELLLSYLIGFVYFCFVVSCGLCPLCHIQQLIPPWNWFSIWVLRSACLALFLNWLRDSALPTFHMFTTLLMKTFLKLLEFKLDISTLSEWDIVLLAVLTFNKLLVVMGIIGSWIYSKLCMFLSWTRKKENKSIKSYYKAKG